MFAKFSAEICCALWSKPRKSAANYERSKHLFMHDGATRIEMLRIFLTAALGVCACCFLAVAVRPGDISARARKLHFSSIVVDTHDDTTQRFLDGKFDLGKRSPAGSIDIPRMKEGNLSAIFFSIWMPSKVTGPDAVNRAIVQIDAV